MAAANPEVSLQDEATCSVCLDYFQDPVSIECGHNFCRSCITQYWEELNTNFPCPQCRKTSRKRNFRPNRELANVTDMVKQLSLKAIEEPARSFCEKHSEALKLFCKDDQQLICVVCDRSKDHRSHAVIPIDEAADEYKEKLQNYLMSLRTELTGIETIQLKQQEKSREVKEKVKIQRQKIVSEFEELHQFLREEEMELLGRLEEEEQEILWQLEKNIIRLAEQNSLLQKLIEELEETYNSTDIGFLKDVKNTLTRGENMKCPVPEPVNTKLRNDTCNYPLQYFTLKKIIKKLNVLSVTLDPETANRSLLLSKDQKSARVGDVWQERPEDPKRFEDSSSVLACEGFTSGRHYWEVGVGDGKIWIVGAAEESACRTGGITSSTDRGVWAVNLMVDHYRALTAPATYLNPSEKPNKLGVYLDNDRGRLSFYNADTMEHLYTFTASFTQKMFPFFCIGPGTEIRL